MGEEMQGVEGDTGWRKAIPRGQDRLQSRVLVGVVGTLLAGVSATSLMAAYVRIHRSPAMFYNILAVSVAFAVLVWLLKAATPAAAALGGMVCYDLTLWTSTYRGSIVRTALTPLAILFFLTFLSTRLGKRRKIKAGLAEGRRGRSAAQVIANLFTAAFCFSPFMFAFIYVGMPGVANFMRLKTMSVMCLATLAEATADTVSSEIGQAFGGPPILLLNRRRVRPGTDGAITWIGTQAGIAGAVLVALAGAWAMRLDVVDACIAAGAGIGGLFFDSLLGATVERRGWLGNDLVNFASTLFAALLAVVVYRLFVL